MAEQKISEAYASLRRARLMQRCISLEKDPATRNIDWSNLFRWADPNFNLSIGRIGADIVDPLEKVVEIVEAYPELRFDLQPLHPYYSELREMKTRSERFNAFANSLERFMNVRRKIVPDYILSVGKDTVYLYINMDRVYSTGINTIIYIKDEKKQT